MDRLKKTRKPWRTVFTRTVNELKTLLGVQPHDGPGMQAKMDSLKSSLEKIQELDVQILDAMLDAVNEAAYEAEIVACEGYADEFRVIARRVEEALTPKVIAMAPPDLESISSNAKKGLKYPKLTLREFNGDLKEWIGWWSQFRKIHEDDNLDPGDKFQYLIQSMEKGSRPRELVESYPQCSENYPKAVKALKDHYGREDVLVEVYVRELLKLQINNVSGHNKLPLASMFVKLEAHLRALETMGVTSDKCAAILYPLMESSLPEDVLRAWQRSDLSRSVVKDDPTKSRLSLLIEFIRMEVEGEQRISLAKAGFRTSHKEKNKVKQARSNYEDELPTAAGLFSGESSVKCCFCEKHHESKDCIKAQDMTLKERRDRVQRSRSCFNCLRGGHQSKSCKVFVKCLLCKGKHPSIMCQEINKGPDKATEKAPVNQNQNENVQTATSQMCTRSVVLQTLMIELVGNGRKKLVRALIDQGSQRSYILAKTALEMNLCPIGESRLVHSLFGGVQTKEQLHNKYSVTLRCSRSNFSCDVEVLGDNQICGRIPRVPRGPLLRQLKERKIWMSDIGDGCPEIELLIGADCFGQLLTGNVQQLESGLTAVQAKLGWTLLGKVSSVEDSNNLALTVMSMTVRDSTIAELWKLDTLGIYDPIEVKSQVEKNEVARKHFLENVSRSEDGRYSVGLPWTDSRQAIPSNRNIAERRLQTATNKLRASGRYDDYQKVFDEWEREGIIEIVPESERVKVAHFLPHRPVFKPESLTTKVRPVFDASCKSGRSPSLNESLEKGPNLLEKIPAILLRFREKKFGVIADIRKAFLMINIKSEDKDYLRFLWWEKEDSKKIVEYRHNRVVFGVTCSPFLLGAVIEYHMTIVGKEEQEIVEKFLKSLYVDNCVTSVDTMDELLEFKEKTTSMLAQAQMELRMWEWSSVESSGIGHPVSGGCRLVDGREKDSSSAVLGYRWDKNEDTLRCEVPEVGMPEAWTKRVLLSTVQQVYDPIGFTCPAVVSTKLLLQEACVLKLGWDEELPMEIVMKFKKWIGELPLINSLKIPRRCSSGNKEEWSIHVFCDASQSAYGAVVFLRGETQHRVSVQLLAAKSRVAPLKKATIPRLELLSCTVASRLASSVVEALDLEKTPITFWSDSSTALAWIRRNDEWGTFVGNRVREICKLTKSCDWRHVPGIMNPADLPSRGCTPAQLLDSRWWEGPEWLKNSCDHWPKDDSVPDETAVAMEKKKCVLAAVGVEKKPEWYERFSSFKKIVRVQAWMRRFIHNYVSKGCRRGSLSVAELHEAEECLMRKVQQEAFKTSSDVISGLCVQNGEDRLIRLKTKLLMRDDEVNFRLPILLPNKHHVVDALIREEHLKTRHGGIQVLMSGIRENYWIIQTRKAIRAIVTKCVRCRRFAGKSPVTQAAPLPKDRVRDALAFEIIGVDLAGPLYLKDKSKVWIALYTCAVYRAVHLELVTALSTESFVQSLRRFIARRGRPSIVYCDNGTNFVGCSNAMKELDWDKIEAESASHKIVWKFNPPSAAWWGGWWERLVRSVKGILVRTLGRAVLGYEELLTLLCDAEATINARPLTYVGEGQDDLVPLTPSMFIQEVRDVGVPDMDCMEKSGFERRFRYRQKLREEFRERFRREYLGLLVQRSSEGKKTFQLKVGDVVLIGADNKKRLEWPMARVVELIPGRDKVIRVARVKTAHGEFVRPVQRLYPLELKEEEIPVEEEVVHQGQEKTEMHTRSGRLVKIPNRLGVCQH